MSPFSCPLIRIALFSLGHFLFRNLGISFIPFFLIFRPNRLAFPFLPGIVPFSHESLEFPRQRDLSPFSSSPVRILTVQIPLSEICHHPPLCYTLITDAGSSRLHDPTPYGRSCDSPILLMERGPSAPFFPLRCSLPFTDLMW